jgi:hypothetical protein
MTEQRGNRDAAQKPSPTAAAHDSNGAHKQISPEADVSPAQVDATASKQHEEDASTADPPLPEEEAPPLPDEPAPNDGDDGWEAKWDYNASAWYFYNHRTGQSQWENPRVPEATAYTQGSYDRFANYHHLPLSFST